MSSVLRHSFGILLYYRSCEILLLALLINLWLPLVDARDRPHNTTIPNTSSQVVWTPSPCNSSSSGGHRADGWWYSQDASGIEKVSTLGPSASEGDMIPQMFLLFQGSGIFIRTSTASTALANVSVSCPSNLSFAQRHEVFNTSSRWWGTSDLSTNATLLFSLTYANSGENEKGKVEGVLEIEEIRVTSFHTPAIPSSSPSLSLPISILPSNSHPTVSSFTSTHRKQTAKAIAGAVLGSVLGLCALLGLGFGILVWRSKRRKRWVAETQWDDADRGKKPSWP